MFLKVGDKVRFLNEAGEGMVTEIKDKKQVLVEVDGFDMPFHIKDLLLVGADNEVITAASLSLEQDEYLTDEEVEHERNSEQWLELFKKRKNERGVPEIDLHIHELIDDFKNLSNHAMRQLQIEHCQKCIETAMKHNIQRFVLIHGVGQGKLKGDIRGLIDLYQNLKCEDASFKLYGYGATEIFVFQGKKR